MSVMDMRITSPMVRALEQAWHTISLEFPELPAVAVTVSGGSMMKGPARYGHFASSRWTNDNGAEIHELFVSGEGLSRSALEVFATLLHEAAHTLNHVAGVQDTSRGGRYHNGVFKIRAESLGLTITQVEKIGWSGTELSAATLGSTGRRAARYRAAIAKLEAALTLYRRAEHKSGSPDRKNNNNGVSLQCPTCERKARMSNAAADAGPLVCWPCYSDSDDLESSVFVPAE